LRAITIALIAAIKKLT